MGGSLVCRRDRGALGEWRLAGCGGEGVSPDGRFPRPIVLIPFIWLLTRRNEGPPLTGTPVRVRKSTLPGPKYLMPVGLVAMSARSRRCVESAHGAAGRVMAAMAGSWDYGRQDALDASVWVASTERGRLHRGSAGGMGCGPYPTDASPPANRTDGNGDHAGYIGRPRVRKP